MRISKRRCKCTCVSLSKKSSNGWAFSYLDGIINMGDERCWNAEKWIVVS